MKVKLVIDANELFSAIIGRGKGLQSLVMDIIFSEKVELFAPFRLLAELEKNRREIKRKSGFSDKEFDAFVEIIKLKIKFIPLEDFLDRILEAKDISPDPKDIEYFALALKLNCRIWSEERRLKRQSRVEVLSTSELIEFLSRQDELSVNGVNVSYCFRVLSI
jgi:predicted nucleic acid-binding protein